MKIIKILFFIGLVIGSGMLLSLIHPILFGIVLLIALWVVFIKIW